MGGGGQEDERYLVGEGQKRRCGGDFVNLKDPHFLLYSKRTFIFMNTKRCRTLWGRA